MKWWKLGIMLLAGVALLAGCKSVRNAEGKESAKERVAGMSQVEKVIAQAPQMNYINAKMRFSLQMGEKELSVGGNFRMKKDDVIQLSLVGLGIIEGGRMEFTRDSVLMVDRIHRQYISVSYDELDFLREAQVDFYTLQALFWNELILPGMQHVTLAEAGDFQVEHLQNELIISNKEKSRLVYRFIASLADGLLKQTEIGTQSGKYALHWSYDKFSQVAGSRYPLQMQIELKGLGTPVKATLVLNRIATDSGWTDRTQVPKRYERVKPDILMKKLLKLQTVSL